MDVTRTVLRTALNSASVISPRFAGRGAFALFKRPPGRTEPVPAARELLSSATRDQIDVHGTAVVTYRWGSGDRPVLLVHGWGSDTARLGAFVPALLGRGHTVLAFDAPGHGGSGGSTTTILEFTHVIRELQDRVGVLSGIVGYSFGSLASFLAVREGVRTQALVALAGVSRMDHLVTAFGSELGLRPVLHDQLRDRVENELFAGQPRIWERFSSSWQPEQVDVPRILLIHDVDDHRAGIDQARETASAYGRRAELVITRGLGHRRITADPMVVARITDFIQARESSDPASDPAAGAQPQGSGHGAD